MPGSDRVYITGGSAGRDGRGISGVVGYTNRNLGPYHVADMNQKRMGHACGYYRDNEDQIVSIYYLYIQKNNS